MTSTSVSSSPSSPSSTWLDAASSAISAHNATSFPPPSSSSSSSPTGTPPTTQPISSELLEVLCAFGGRSHAPGPANLVADDSGTSEEISAKIGEELVDEVDVDQAAMFGRRFDSVSQLLLSSSGSSSGSDGRDGAKGATSQPQEPSASALIHSLLRLALHRRAIQILSTPSSIGGPRALRIRALVDFIWSQALVLGRCDERRGLPKLVELVQNDVNEKVSDGEKKKLVYDEFAPGLRHATLEGQTSDYGPIHINVLRIAPHSVTMECVDARTIPNESTGSSSCTDLVQLAKQKGALAAISGGFFLYSEPDIEEPSKRTDPVGLLVNGGKIQNPSMFKRASLVQERSGNIKVERVGMDGIFLKIGDGVDAVGFKVGRNGVRIVHRGECKEAKIHKIGQTDGEVALSIVGTTVHKVYCEVPCEDEKEVALIPVPLAGFLLVLPGDTLPSDDDYHSLQGEEVTYTFPPEHSAITAAMAGGPILLSPEHHADEALDLPSEDFRGSAPPVTFSQDETFDRNLLPRMGAGVTEDGELVLVAVDGRNLDRALGLTLRGTAELLEALGCVRALNLDGGSSKRMVIRHRTDGHKVVCLSTTEIKAKSADDSSKEETADDAANAEDVEAVDDVGEDMETHKGRNSNNKTAKVEEKKEVTPEVTRPVHSAILFLPIGK